MEDAKRILQEFIDLDSSIAFPSRYFKTKEGKGHQGSLIEIEGEDLVYFSSGPMADLAEIRIPVSDIDLESLSYYHQRRKEWVDFRPGEPVDEA